MRVRRVVLLLLLPVLAVAGLWQLFGGASGGNPAYTPPPPSVGVARITMREIEEHIEALGTTSSWESIEVRSTVTEFVEAIHFSDGQAVARNDPLLTLVQREEVAKLAEARAFLDEQIREVRRIEGLVASKSCHATSSTNAGHCSRLPASASPAPRRRWQTAISAHRSRACSVCAVSAPAHWSRRRP